MSVGGTAVKTYGYDAAGRTTSVVTFAGTTTLAYDFESRATSISGPGVSQTNTYNGLDTRVGSTTNSASRTFLRDGAYVTDPVLSDGAAVYTPGISERRGTATTFLHSGLKNADSQSGTSQTVGATRQYDAFGNLTSSTGTWSGPFGYAGAFGYQEDATGLRLLGHRYYDPTTGRFLTRDPIKDGRNWYVYCENDPLRGADPSGLAPEWLERTWKSVQEFWDDTNRVIRPGIKIIFIVPALVALGCAIYNADHEADLYREYRRGVHDAMAQGKIPILEGEELIRKNRPGVEGPAAIIRKFWELLIEAS